MVAGSFGIAYVIYGGASFNASVDLTDIAQNLNGGYGLIGDISSVSGVGDLNGDGRNELLLGAVGQSKSYLFFGVNDPSGLTSVNPGTLDGAPIDLNLVDLSGGGTQLRDGGSLYGKGVVFDGELGSSAGADVSGIGDINGDGIDNFIIGAPNAAADTATTATKNAGQAYIVYGQDFGTAGTQGVGVLSQAADADGDLLNGGSGKDILDSAGHANVALVGGGGNDVLRVNGTELGVEGGSGVDILTPDQDDIDLDFDALANKSTYQDVEQVQLNGFGANTLKLELRDVLDMSGTLDELLVTGDGGVDRVESQGYGWTGAGKETRNVYIDQAGITESLTFNVYTALDGAATLLIQNDLDQSLIS